MFRIKRLNTFLLQNFLPVFLMTFFICLFIILMQFLWKYIDEWVGKGLELGVLVELFFYAALTFVPMALPLAVLLASLMTFGNLGERLELLAMKASGISLFRIMKPIIVVMVFVSLGAFYFQNIISPLAQVRLYALLFSVRMKSPEFNVPTGIFYDQLGGMNLYVDRKDVKSGMLYEMMIYDFSQGFDNAMLIVADSGKMKMAEDQKSLFLTLHHGESFQTGDKRAGTDYPSFHRETFSMKSYVIDFDGNFNRMDEGALQNQYIAKNVDELAATVDSVSLQLDSILRQNQRQALAIGFLHQRTDPDQPLAQKDKPEPPVLSDTVSQPNLADIDLDSLYRRVRPDKWDPIYSTAASKAELAKQDYEFKKAGVEAKFHTLIRHKLEWHKKFTLSFACMIFFFIGAPLGAIIRKGGIGMPAVISVFLFICYFFLDNSGANLARTRVLPPFGGMWLSSMILLPLGVFFTYKAVNDSVIMNADTYLLFFKNLIKRPMRRLEYDMSDRPYDLTTEGMIEAVKLLVEQCNAVLKRDRRMIWSRYRSFWLDNNTRLEDLNRQLERRVINQLKFSSDKLLVLKLSDYPVLQPERCTHPFTDHSVWVKQFMCYCLPLGLFFYLFSWWGFYIMYKDLQKTQAINQEILKQMGVD